MMRRNSACNSAEGGGVTTGTVGGRFGQNDRSRITPYVRLSSLKEQFEQFTLLGKQLRSVHACKR
jgi:hypothetical protein